MDYEKKYKDVLERANSLLSGNELRNAWIYKLFPELKESEDEKIRKEIIYHIQNCDDTIDEVTEKRMLAWLEKQGEQKQDPCEKCDHFTLNCHNFPCIKKRAFEQGKCVFDIINEEKVDNANKVEPKFKVGDWIVKNNGSDCFSDGSYVLQIIDIDCNRYKLSNGCYLTEPFVNTYRLWTVQDAKDGDVLVEDSCIFIIQKLGDNSTAAKTYCTLYDDGDFDNGTILYFDIDSTKPATKEQCNLLFQKMKEAGYEWDAENKELKKIHVIDEGKAEMDYCFTKMMNGEKVSSAWSREDEQNLNAALSYINDDSLCRWLKDVVHVKYDKPAWSEEDENVINELIKHFKSLLGCLATKERHMENRRWLNWLKSLKERMKGE